MPRSFNILGALIMLTASGACRPSSLPGSSTPPISTPAAATDLSRDALIFAHPAGPQLASVLAACATRPITPTGITRDNYLRLIAADIDVFAKYQDPSGAIIDPVSHGERQYSTPAFAAAAGCLVHAAHRPDLRLPATRALTCALTALVEKRSADGHADFYIPLLVHAYRFLHTDVSPDQNAAWQALFRRINPETMYRADLRAMNWNIVSSAGELLRRHDNLVAPEARAAQETYLESCLAGHLPAFTPTGLFQDPHAPMAYDAFSRLWLEDVFADHAYTGPLAPRIDAFLRTGALSTLLLLSPSGEWSSGGRSALHNWTDLQITAICEMNANHFNTQGQPAVAGSFKRAAHLAFASAARWQRPTGELNIIKNRADPARRFAYETYSNHSQYNLLPMAMLAIAYARANDTIPERAAPSEVGGYVFDLRNTFHKVAAAAGGYYILIDTAADPHYNATGLQRVHRAGVPFPAFSDTTAAERAYGPTADPNLALSPGITWHSPDHPHLSLADFSLSPDAPAFPASPSPSPSPPSRPSPDSSPHPLPRVLSAELTPGQLSPNTTDFKLTYTLESTSPLHVTETYRLTPAGVTQCSTIVGAPGPYAVAFPVLTSDGATNTSLTLTDTSAAITTHGSTTTITASPLAQPLTLAPTKIPNHNGYIQTAAAPLLDSTNTATLTYTLTQSPP